MISFMMLLAVHGRITLYPKITAQLRNFASEMGTGGASGFQEARSPEIVKADISIHTVNLV